jgi:hypothetical protein
MLKPPPQSMFGMVEFFIDFFDFDLLNDIPESHILFAPQN